VGLCDTSSSSGSGSQFSKIKQPEPMDFGLVITRLVLLRLSLSQDVQTLYRISKVQDHQTGEFKQVADCCQVIHRYSHSHFIGIKMILAKVARNPKRWGHPSGFATFLATASSFSIIPTSGLQVHNISFHLDVHAMSYVEATRAMNAASFATSLRSYSRRHPKPPAVKSTTSRSTD